jgi:hypothetical protein
MQSVFGCFNSAGSTPAGRPGWSIPRDFVRRAADHIGRTGQPYLAHRADDYRVTVFARPIGDGRYELRAGDLLERAAPTWRDLYRHRYAGRWSEIAFRECFGIDADVWDEPAEAAAADEMLLGGWRAGGQGVSPGHPIHELVIPLFRDEDNEHDLGRLAWVTDPTHEKGRTLVASSAMALSCLQYWLDEAGFGVRLQVRDR